MAEIQGDKSWYQSPYLAPLTEPARMLGRAIMAPMNPWLDGVREARTPAPYDKRTFLSRLYRAWADMDDDNVAPEISAFIGGGIAALAGAIATAVCLSASVPVVAAACIAAGAVSFVAAPFAIMAVAGFAGACIGAVAAPWGVLKGVGKAVQHFRAEHARPVVPQVRQEKPVVCPPPAERAVLAGSLRTLFEPAKAPGLADDTPGRKSAIAPDQDAQLKAGSFTP